jgi:hypothetical protein
MRLIALITIVTTLGCAGTGTFGKNTTLPIDFAYEINESHQSMASFRGRPVFLVLMSTADLACQAYVLQLKEAYDTLERQVELVVLTIEPSEAAFVQAYADFEELPFPIGVASPEVKSGETSLGIVPRVPITYLIDKAGYVQNVAVGILESREVLKRAKRLL